MCGIAGIVTSDPDRQRRVGDMLAAMAHRGPDDEGVDYLDGVALGHRRLSILDLEGGHQPMFSADGAVGIVFNGEIYNFPRLRRELEREGRRFTTDSDTELILHLYQMHGDECVRRLDGMFAFGIWDAPRRRLLLARDHMGQKPLFFAQIGETFVFASEVKGVLASGIVRPEVHLEALYHYISLRFIPDRLTLFNGVHKLPAAHRLVLEAGTARVERFWSFSFRDKMRGSEEEILDALDDALREAVRAHTLADVPVGAFLSGGIDSSLVTAMMAEQARDPVPTFSIGVEEASLDELPYARMVARRYATDHHEEVARADLVRRLPRMIWHMDEPADPFGVGVFLVSELAARHVKVVLSGDGGDELFAGYDRFAGDRLAAAWGIVPAVVRRSLVRRLIDWMPESYGYKGLSQKLRWVNEMSLTGRDERYAESLSFLRFSEAAKAELFTDAARRSLGALDSRRKILDHFHADTADELLERMLYTDLMTRMPDHLLPIVDRMAMAHGLEVRPPLMEHRMVEFAARVPASLKLRGTTLKYLLRRLGERYLDPELVSRPKQGFGFPLADWMRRDLRPFLRHTADESRLVAEGLFEPAYIRGLIDAHLGGRRDHNFRIWLLVNLEIWYRLFVEGGTVDDVSEWVERHAA